MRQLLFTLGLAVCLPIHSSLAAKVFDTASQPILNAGGPQIGDFNWPFHRFQVATTTSINSVGGYFTNYFDADVAFAAIVQLTGSNDNPNSIDLSTSDVVATTLLSVGVGEGFATAPLSLTLSPGWYALQFGTNAFGAASAGSLAFHMTDHTTDLDAFQSVRVAVQNGHPTLPAGFIGVQGNYRFFATTIPEPATIILVGIALAAAAMHRSHAQAGS